MTKDIPPGMLSCTPFEIPLDVPVGPERIFTAFGVDATKRTIGMGNSRALTLTPGKPESVDIILEAKGVSEASPLTEARADHTATLLQDGKVLVVGGGRGPKDSGPVLNSAELFDPCNG